ncbi:MAG TPA: MFS transporter, partial [Miltoncostaeaceae bacterium]|nr:MFS transporter [Miltoncostaeaceae bacterium]
MNDGAIGTGGAALARGRYWLLLAGAFIVYASANAVVPIAEELRALLGRAPGGAGVFLAPFATGFGIGCLVWFLLARTRPARLVLPLALAVTGLGGLLSVLALGEGGMMWGRLLAGLGAAGYPAAAQALIATGAPSARRGQMIGGFITAVVAGSFIGQALVGALAELSSARLALVVVCTIAPALAALALWRALPAAPDARRVARVSYVPPRAIAPAMAVALLAFAGYWLLLAELPAALRTERYGLGAAAAGTLSLLGLLGAVTALVAGRVADRRGQRLPATVTLIIGVAGLTLTLSPATPLWLFAVGYGLFLAAYWALL